MTDTTMRLEFESWFSEDGKVPEAVTRKGENYLLMSTANAWWAWQAATERATPQWQDIATAPKDTTSILVFNKHFILEAWYSSQWDRYVVSETGGTNHINPSHWMPLPPPPAIRQGGAE